MPGGVPPWKVVYARAARWHAAGVFEALLADLRGMTRLGEGPITAAFVDQGYTGSTPAHDAAQHGVALLGVRVHARCREITPILPRGTPGLLLVPVTYGRSVLRPIW